MLTDNEIKKALECCCSSEGCRGCRYDIGSATCIKNLMKDSADLINRQQAEIEELKCRNQKLTSENENLTSDLKSVKAECERLQNYKGV